MSFFNSIQETGIDALRATLIAKMDKAIERKMFDRDMAPKWRSHLETVNSIGKMRELDLDFDRAMVGASIASAEMRGWLSQTKADMFRGLLANASDQFQVKQVKQHLNSVLTIGKGRKAEGRPLPGEPGGDDGTATVSTMDTAMAMALAKAGI